MPQPSQQTLQTLRIEGLSIRLTVILLTISTLGVTASCKVDRAVYQTLTPESSILDCVTMWEGEPGFALDGTGDFDGVYTPEFWGRIWEDETYVYAGVADGELPGWQFFERTIGGRYFGSKDANGKMTSIANP